MQQENEYTGQVQRIQLKYMNNQKSFSQISQSYAYTLIWFNEF